MSQSQTIEKRTLTGATAGVVLFALSIVQSIIIVPILLRYWGEYKYGEWIALWAFVLLTRTFDVGHLSFIGNEVTKYFYTDPQKSFSILGSGVRIAFLLGALEIVLYSVLMLSGLVDDFIGVPAGEDFEEVKYGILIALVPWVIAGGTLSVVLRIMPAVGKYAETIYFAILLKVLELTVFIYCGFTNRSILTVCVSISVSIIVYDVLLFWYLRKNLREAFPWWRKGSWSEGFSNFRRSLALTVNSFFEQYLTNGIIVVISKFVSLASVPAFLTTRTLTNTAMQAASIVMDPITPDLIRYHTQRDVVKIRQVFLTNWFILGLLINIPLIVIMPFLEDIYLYWTAFKISLDVNLFIFLALGVSLASFGRPLMTLIRGLNLTKELNFITLARCVITFGISLLLIRQYGIFIVAAALFAAEVVCSLIVPVLILERAGRMVAIRDYAIGMLPTLILMLYFFFYARIEITRGWWALFCLLLQVAYSVYIWKYLSPEVRKRLTGLLPFKIPLFSR